MRSGKCFRILDDGWGEGVPADRGRKILPLINTDDTDQEWIWEKSHGRDGWATRASGKSTREARIRGEKPRIGEKAESELYPLINTDDTD